jgi:hypothetical protein
MYLDGSLIKVLMRVRGGQAPGGPPESLPSARPGKGPLMFALSETGWGHNSETGWGHSSETGWGYSSETGWGHNSETGWGHSSETGWGYSSETSRG